jgi:phosphoglycerol transferase MdoB-like AlkP superfamily enzyme
MDFILLILIIVSIGLPLGNILGWWMTRPYLDGPWNWRALVWAGLYVRWLEQEQLGMFKNE